MLPSFIVADSRVSSPALAALCYLRPVCLPRNNPALPGCTVWIPNFTLRPVSSILPLDKEFPLLHLWDCSWSLKCWKQHFSHTWSLSVTAAFGTWYFGWAAPAGGDLGKGILPLSYRSGWAWSEGEGRGTLWWASSPNAWKPVMCWQTMVGT